jgi:hypothetical protein
MARLTDIQNAWIADALANITGLKTAASHERDFDESTLASLGQIALPPFALFRYAGSDPTESERGADGSSGMSSSKFALALGAASLISRKENQKGCYELRDDFKERYNGFDLAVTGGATVHLAYEGDGFLFSGGGVMVYYMLFSYSE